MPLGLKTVQWLLKILFTYFVTCKWDDNFTCDFSISSMEHFKRLDKSPQSLKTLFVFILIFETCLTCRVLHKSVHIHVNWRFTYNNSDDNNCDQKIKVLLEKDNCYYLRTCSDESNNKMAGFFFCVQCRKHRSSQQILNTYKRLQCISEILMKHGSWSVQLIPWSVALTIE